MLSANSFWNSPNSTVGWIFDRGGGVCSMEELMWLKRQGHWEAVLSPNKGINCSPFPSSPLPFAEPR